jgi:hypothetical protein
VVNAVVDGSTPLFDALKSVDAAVEGVVGAAQSELIGGALTEFFATVKPDLVAVENRIPAAIHGAISATNAIVEGDETMAASMEQAAAASAVSGDFSVFGAPGGGG